MRSMRALAAVLFAAVLLPSAAAAQPRPAGAADRGEHVYRNLCWTCHGRYGRGDGPAVENLERRPPDFTVWEVIGPRFDEEIIARIKGAEDGPHRSMVVGETVKEQALRDAIAYIRTMAVPGKHVSVLAGKDIYTGSCWVCHGERGDGKGPAAPNLVDAKPRDFTSPEFQIEGRELEVYEAISRGAAEAFHGSSYMPAWGASLSPQQIRDVMEFLKGFRAPSPP